MMHATNSYRKNQTLLRDATADKTANLDFISEFFFADDDFTATFFDAAPDGCSSRFATPAILSLLENLDASTAAHCRRVCEYSVRLGRRAGMDESALWQLRLSALLHDCGKAKISRALLEKPTFLTVHETRKMQRHPLHGTELLAPFAPFSFALPVVRHHHERFDGRGYPDGLAGEEIPTQARLVAVADAFDAMTSERVYCRSYAPGIALNALVAGRGTQFDAAYVDLFVEEMGGAKSLETPRESSPIMFA